VLRIVADRILTELHDEELIARLGGDEFVVLIPEQGQPARVEMLARRLLESIARPVDSAGSALLINCFIGLASVPWQRPQDCREQGRPGLLRRKTQRTGLIRLE